MAEQTKTAFQRVEGTNKGTYLFDGDMQVNRSIWEVLTPTILAEMITDIQNRVKKDKGLKQAEQVYEFGEKKIIFTDKQSVEKRKDESIDTVIRRRNHAFTVKVLG